jgi:hypothetical protein
MVAPSLIFMSLLADLDAGVQATSTMYDNGVSNTPPRARPVILEPESAPSFPQASDRPRPPRKSAGERPRSAFWGHPGTWSP